MFYTQSGATHLRVCREAETVKQIVVRFLMGAALLALTAVPAAAQIEVGVGWARQCWNGCAANGLAIDFSAPIRSTDSTALSIVGDLGWTRFRSGGETEETDTTIVGGVRYKFLRNRRVNVFVQGTAGLVHWKEAEIFGGFSGNQLLVGGGGGVQFVLTDMIDAKVQLDWWGTKDPDFEDWDLINRIFVAVVFKLGER